jgi:hypothetical protein
VRKNLSVIWAVVCFDFEATPFIEISLKIRLNHFIHDLCHQNLVLSDQQLKHMKCMRKKEQNAIKMTERERERRKKEK